MTSIRTLQQVGLTENLQAILLDLLIETDLHREYQEAFIASLPPELRARAIAAAREREETIVYLYSRWHEFLEILGKERTHDPETPAIRACPRPLSVEKMTV
jgi:hypothetical protein